MKEYKKEVEENFAKFSNSYKSEAEKTRTSLEAFEDKYLTSYQRIVSLQAWRSELMETDSSEGSIAFFLEAQNDALTSHAHARFGSWRSALKSLRSCIENVFFCVYYKDHPVELQLWENGAQRLNFSEVEGFLEKHPALSGVPSQLIGLATLKKEYSTLSRAVHASARSFRMSVEGIGLKIWSAEPEKLGAWSTRERETISGINHLLTALFREKIQGSRLPGLRKALSLVFPPTQHSAIKKHLGVTLF